MTRNAPATGGTSALVARLNRIPIATRSQRRWGLLIGGVLVFELADLQTFGLVAPVLRTRWGLSIETIGWVTSLAFLGMFAGAVVGGRLCDRFGRKWSLIWSTVFFSAFSLLCATASNVTELGVYRVLTGAGLTAMTIIALAYVSEMYPKHLRGRYLSWIFGTGLLGIPAISFFARWVVPLGENGWRWVFVVGGLGILVAALMMRGLPESVRWQAQYGDAVKAERRLSMIEDEARAQYGAELPEPVLEQPHRTGSVRDLFGPTYRRRTIVFLIASIFTLLGFYGYSALLPTLLVERGFAVVESLTFTSVTQIGAIPGALVAWLFIDRWERRYTMGATYVIIALLAVVYGFAHAAGVIVICGFLISMLLQTSTVLAYTYGPEIFPTELRGVGNGLGNGLGRLATFGGSNLLPVIYATLGYAAVFLYVAIVLAAAGILLMTMGERTTRRSLEEIEKPDGSVVAPSTDSARLGPAAWGASPDAG